MENDSINGYLATVIGKVINIQILFSSFSVLCSGGIGKKGASL